jgi:hypothetical protein
VVHLELGGPAVLVLAVPRVLAVRQVLQETQVLQVQAALQEVQERMVHLERMAHQEQMVHRVALDQVEPAETVPLAQADQAEPVETQVAQVHRELQELHLLALHQGLADLRDPVVVQVPAVQVELQDLAQTVFTETSMQPQHTLAQLEPILRYHLQITMQ